MATVRPTIRLFLAVCLLFAIIGGGGASAAERATGERPDDAPGRQQIHVIYVLPSDGADRSLDSNGTLEASVGSWQAWLKGQTGGPGLNLDTAGGVLDITFVRLDMTDAQLAATGLNLRDELEARLRERGFVDASKIYAVYYDGSASNVCGGAAYPPTLKGHVAAQYLRGVFTAGAAPCESNPFTTPGGPPGYWEYGMLHEIVHTLGYVASCAPHHTRAGHASDSPSDLMYAGDEAWVPSVLDVGRDDYFGTSSGCLDLSQSGYLEGNPFRDLPGEDTRCKVPKIVGLKVAPAFRRVQRAGCARGRVSMRAARNARERGRAGRIVSQRPKAGKLVPPGTKVTAVAIRARRR